MIDGKKIFGAILIAVALFFFWPAAIGTWQEVSALRATVSERQDLLKARTQILADTAAAYQQYTAKLSSQDGLKFAALVPVKKDQAEILSALQDIAASSGVTLGELRVSDATGKEAGQFKTLSLTMDLTGSYRSLRTFLGDVEQYVRLLNVQTIQATTDPRSPGQLKFTVKADTYFLK